MGIGSERRRASTLRYISSLARPEIVEDALSVPPIAIAEVLSSPPRKYQDQSGFRRRQDASTPLVVKRRSAVGTASIEHLLRPEIDLRFRSQARGQVGTTVMNWRANYRR